MRGHLADNPRPAGKPRPEAVPGKMWCVAKLDEEYIARVEEVLAVYEKPLSAQEPVVCVDEKPVVLHRDVRSRTHGSTWAERARRDNEYQRYGTANVFCGVEPKAERHFTRVTTSRSSPYFADYMQECRPLSPGQNHSPGTGQPEVAYLQGRGGKFWRKRRQPVVGKIHGTLHSQTRQLAQPGRDCHQPVLPPVPRAAAHRGSGSSPQRSPRMESPCQSRPRYHSVKYCSQARSQKVCLLILSVTVLALYSYY